jgi:hypothetical protein
MSELCVHGVGSCALGIDEPYTEGPAQLAELPIKQYAKPAKLRRYARLARLVYVAASRAIEDAGVDDPSSLAVVTATAMGELTASLKLLEQIHEKRGRGISPALVPNTVHNAPAGHLTIGIGSRCPSVTVSQGWLSAEAALLAAADLIEIGGADRALVIIGDECDPSWVERLEQADARPWARDLGQEAFQEGAVALVVGREPGGRRLGRVAARVERVGDRAAFARELIEAEGARGSSLEIRVRHGAAGGELADLLSNVRPAVLDGPGAGSSQAGAAAVLLERMRDPQCERLLLIGAELDEVGVLSFRR